MTNKMNHFWQIRIGSTFTLNGELFSKINQKEAQSTKDHRTIEVEDETEVVAPVDYKAI